VSRLAWQLTVAFFKTDFTLCASGLAAPWESDATGQSDGRPVHTLDENFFQDGYCAEGGILVRYTVLATVILLRSIDPPPSKEGP
jgi:hypothetical protein